MIENVGTTVLPHLWLHPRFHPSIRVTPTDAPSGTLFATPGGWYERDANLTPNLPVTIPLTLNGRADHDDPLQPRPNQITYRRQAATHPERTVLARHRSSLHHRDFRTNAWTRYRDSGHHLRRRRIDMGQPDTRRDGQQLPLRPTTVTIHVGP